MQSRPFSTLLHTTYVLLSLSPLRLPLRRPGLVFFSPPFALHHLCLRQSSNPTVRVVCVYCALPPSWCFVLCAVLFGALCCGALCFVRFPVSCALSLSWIRCELRLLLPYGYVVARSFVRSIRLRGQSTALSGETR